MASKYAGLYGTIPEEPTQREAAVIEAIKERSERTPHELTAEHNTLSLEAEGLAKQVKQLSIKMTAVEALIRERLDSLNGEALSINGKTWSRKFEPYPVCDDPAAIVKYFKEHDMEDSLELTKTELATRLKAFVKEEALNNELIIETVKDPVTGEDKIDVRSQIPGVRVFLKAGLSHPKSKKE